MQIYTIYKSTNKINGCSYIGFDKNWPARKRGHKSSYKKQNRNSKFYNAIQKYGWDNFDWEIIYQSKDYDHTFKTMESYFIEQYDTLNNGYNMTKGGDGFQGDSNVGAPKGRIPWNKGKTGLQKHSEETKIKMSKSHKGKPAHNKGIPMSDIAKEKASKAMSATRKEKFWSTKKITHI
jgi:group I intron endonuclease